MSTHSAEHRDAAAFGRALLLTAAALLLLVCGAWLFLRDQTSVYSPPLLDRPTQSEELGLMLQSASGSTAGLYVLAVTENGLAAEAGIAPGDLLTEANGDVLTSVSELNLLLAALPPEDVLTVTLRRDHCDMTIALLDAP